VVPGNVEGAHQILNLFISSNASEYLFWSASWQFRAGEGSDLCADHATYVNGCNSDASASRLDENSLCLLLAREQ
jgi:hypothetical protein